MKSIQKYMRTLQLLVFSGLIICLAGCSDDKITVTKKIQYDVSIESPDPAYDWWIQNLVGPERENLVNLIIDGAKQGKWQAYDYFNKAITGQEVRNLFSDSIYTTVVRNEPPYEFYDTLIINNIIKTDIKRIRFLEEWYIDPKSLQFSKKVLGIAPIARRYDSQGIERWQPLFWIYIDDEFLKGLNK